MPCTLCGLSGRCRKPSGAGGRKESSSGCRSNGRKKRAQKLGRKKHGYVRAPLLHGFLPCHPLANRPCATMCFPSSPQAIAMAKFEAREIEPGHGPSRWCWPTAGYHPRTYVPGGEMLLLPGEFTPAASGPGATLVLPLKSPAAKTKLEQSPPGSSQTVGLLESPKRLLLLQRGVTSC